MSTDCTCCSEAAVRSDRPPAERSGGEAYRLLFPLGLLHVMTAVGLWLSHGFWGWPDLGAAVHVQLVLQGFFGGFAAGFLMTMAPRLLGAPAPAWGWRWSMATLLLLGAAAVLGGWQPGAQLALATVFLLLMAFGLRCLLRSARRPPPRMALAGIALLLGAAAALATAGDAAGLSLPAAVALGAREILAQGVLLLLTCAIAPFLLPQLALGAAPQPQALFLPRGRPRHYLGFAALGLLLAASFPLHAQAVIAGGSVEAPLARLLLALRFVLVLLLLAPARVLLRPRRPLPIYLYVATASLLSMLAGLALTVFWPQQAMAWKHLIFVTGFLLLTLVVGARVLTAHAGRSGELEASGRVMASIAVLVLFAAAARIGAEWTDSRVLHLGLAAFFAVAALVLWSIRYGALTWVAATREGPVSARVGACS